jgi:hypothetical protein
MSEIHWQDLNDMASAIVDMGLNIMLYKGFCWKRVWAFLINQTEGCGISILLAKKSIYEEFLQRGGEPLENSDSLDSD